jgi:uncharacterized protein
MANEHEDILNRKIKQFFISEAFGVVGASNDRKKYGNKVLRCYMQHQKKVYPVHPSEQKIEGIACVSSVSQLPDTVKSLSIITPPNITEKIITQAIDRGIRNIWMQPGAESSSAVKECEANNINIIYGGPCILVVMKYRESDIV